MDHIAYQGSTIYDAALKGNFPLVVLLWGMVAAQQSSPFTPDEHNNSIVHFAAAGGNVEILHFFAQQAMLVSPNVTTIMDALNNNGETPLIRAAHVGNSLAVKVLVDMGCNMMHQDANGNTAAHHAAHEGHLWTLHYLLEAQVVTDTESVRGGQCCMKRDVLQWACEGGKEQTINYILNRGHNPNIPDIEGRTALHHATLDADKDLIKKLVSYGAETNASDDRGLTALSTANNLGRHTIVNMLLHTSRLSNDLNPVPKSFGHRRRTRLHVMALYAVLWVACLSLSYVAPWYLFLPGLLVAMVLSMRSMAKRNHKHSKDLKTNIPFPPHVALTLVRHTRGSVFEIQETQVELHRLLQEERPLHPLGKAWRWLKGQPEVAIGLWLGWFIGFSASLGHRVYVDIAADTLGFWNDHVVVLGVLVSLESICMVMWMVLITGDPGQVATADKDFPVLLQKAANGFDPLEHLHCITCLVAKPIRSKHCASCGMCVARMDHHCIWINTCVGLHNHRLFVLFLIGHWAVLALYFTLVVLCTSIYSEEFLYQTTTEMS
ncbi:hypothetical protein, variant [Aphanomyces astaci]|uniref:Palmitoyltransferase n=1 Tax=Aphanomyces astaci TaxID=112090 RepID=W4GSV2_APHAT|nr:hypothetical protein, variant [Aphanomyces astaci]ETV82421.1 hypothetical protein, variant [Aphanomyces astaci]|eukprot:XP_009828090.1 hypothetical protein, variant [Aphanomyces astaci]